MKQKPIDNIKNFYQPNKHAHLFRSPSTPSLKRIWICHTCGLENNSVTWHCLNCECVSYLAPIYKETLKKKTSFDCDTRDQQQKCTNDTASSSSHGSKHSIIATTASSICAGTQPPTSTTPQKLQSMDGDSSVDKITAITTINQYAGSKCHLCLYKTKPAPQHLTSAGGTNGATSIKEPICRHQARTKYLRFPLIGQTTKVGPEQKSFDDSKYYVQNGLYYSNRKINKSLSSITDSFGAGGGIENSSSSIFGERIVYAKNRPNTLLVSEDMNTRRTTSKGTSESYVRQLSVPNPQQAQFNDFITLNVEEQTTTTTTTTIKRSILCDVCGVCNQNRCSRSINNSNNEPSSRFTITTLSRASSNQTLKNHQTLPRNGGVFIAVRDWSTDATRSQQKEPARIVSRTNSIQDGYYEILKNPNNPPYENQTIINKELEQSHTYENSQHAQEPIYAVVNKMNKTKNKIQSQQSEPKFTYIGMNAKSVNSNNSAQPPPKPLSEPDSLYASIGPNKSVDGDGGKSLSSHITITSSVDHPGSDTSEIYAKVWKGPRKSLDSQKMYGNFSTNNCFFWCLFVFSVAFFIFPLFIVELCNNYIYCFFSMLF